MTVGSLKSSSISGRLRLLKHIGAGVLFLCSTALSLDAVGTTYYRWVDDEGTTHFTSTPPKGRPAEKVRSGTGTAAANPTAGGAATADTKPDQQQAAAPNAEAPEPTGELKDANRCAIAQERLQRLEAGGRIRVQTEDGGFRYLTPDDIETELAVSRAAIAESC